MISDSCPGCRFFVATANFRGFPTGKEAGDQEELTGGRGPEKFGAKGTYFVAED